MHVYINKGSLVVLQNVSNGCEAFDWDNVMK